jgi:hypothetical protein
MNGRRPVNRITRGIRRAGIVALAVLATAAAAPAAAAGVAFARPGLLTSIGQSADVAIVKVRLNAQLKLGFEYKPTAQPPDLVGIKTLVVVLGFSTKGLGAAGLDMASEMARTRALLKAARARGVQVLAMHTGGAGRRGQTSDDLIKLVVPDADCTIVVASGNRDRLFNQLAAGRHAPVIEVETAAAAGDAVKTVFK